MEKMQPDSYNQYDPYTARPQMPEEVKTQPIDTNASTYLLGYFLCWIVMVIYLLVVAYLVQVCWNYIAPDVFKMGNLDYKRSIALVVVWKLLNIGDLHYSFNHHKHYPAV